jgi:hypothetical protein
MGKETFPIQRASLFLLFLFVVIPGTSNRQGGPKVAPDYYYLARPFYYCVCLSAGFVPEQKLYIIQQVKEK